MRKAVAVSTETISTYPRAVLSDEGKFRSPAADGVNDRRAIRSEYFTVQFQQARKILTVDGTRAGRVKTLRGDLRNFHATKRIFVDEVKLNVNKATRWRRVEFHCLFFAKDLQRLAQ